MRRLFHCSALLALVAFSACTGSKEKSDSRQAPHIDSAFPVLGTAGTVVTIIGSDFGDEQGAGIITFGGINAAVQSWSDEQIVATVPVDAYPGSRDVAAETEMGTSNLVEFMVVLPRALYVNSDVNDANSIEGFAVSSSGSLSALGGSPWLQGIDGPGGGGYFGTAALDAARRRVLTTANSRLTAWQIDPTTGVLTSSGTLALPGVEYAYGIAIDQSGSRAYVADFTSGAVVGASISSDGTLASIPGMPVDAGPAFGVSGLALSVDGTYLYANHEGTGDIYGFLVGANGSLAVLPGSPYSQADPSTAFQRAPGADRLYVSNPTYITAWEPDEAGDLHENVALRENMPGGSLSLALSGDGTRLFAPYFAQLFVFDVAMSGELVAVSGSPFTLSGVTNVTNVRSSQDGSVLLMKESFNGAPVHLYSVSAAGMPTEVAGSPFPLQPGSFGSGEAFAF